jgi:hypothetical protein
MKIIAVTIGAGSETYRWLANEAARRCRWATGLETVIRTDNDVEAAQCPTPFHYKLRLLNEFPDRTILYFDADAFFIKKTCFDEYAGRREFVCVRDLGNDCANRDADKCGVPREDYFNSGFFVANAIHHAQLFQMAYELYGTGMFQEQSPLNVARLRLGVPTLFLDRRYNAVSYHGESYGDDVILAHFNRIGCLPLRRAQRKVAPLLSKATENHRVQAL